MIEKGNLISEGKAKSLYETQNQNELLMVYRDDTSAFDGKKKEALKGKGEINNKFNACLLYTSPSPRDSRVSRMPSSA